MVSVKLTCQLIQEGEKATSQAINLPPPGFTPGTLCYISVTPLIVGEDVPSFQGESSEILIPLCHPGGSLTFQDLPEVSCA